MVWRRRTTFLSGFSRRSHHHWVRGSGSVCSPPASSCLANAALPSEFAHVNRNPHIVRERQRSSLVGSLRGFSSSSFPTSPSSSFSWILPSSPLSFSTVYYSPIPRRANMSSKVTQTVEEESSSSTNDEEPSPESWMVQDRILPCGEHLDPEGNMLPKSDWIKILGTLPIGSLNHVLNSVEQILQKEDTKGIIDLDAEWNPFVNAQVPILSLDEYSSSLSSVSASSSSSSSSPSLDEEKPKMIQAAHVVISPFGRPTGWRLKLANRSLVYTLLARGEQMSLRIGWKVVQMSEYHYTQKGEEKEDPAFTFNHGLIVDDTMVRIENCPVGTEPFHIRAIVSRYQLASEGNTILQWKGRTNDGKVSPLLYIVRFADPSWARAAIRELQGLEFRGNSIKLIQYPNQIRYVPQEEMNESL